jgi:hypothetical protein
MMLVLPSIWIAVIVACIAAIIREIITSRRALRSLLDEEKSTPED